LAKFDEIRIDLVLVKTDAVLLPALMPEIGVHISSFAGRGF